ncbi:unnamed protein product [Ambrosiozyma monospora]|uniref:Unnamed protein product n=1 Tax=Ambrosiozyma monospora TaxID=43982 RepID=A0ACB5UC15_AMBMO|nr:unnamed protein product [Ambrosiozyma monospora]
MVLKSEEGTNKDVSRNPVERISKRPRRSTGSYSVNYSSNNHRNNNGFSDDDEAFEPDKEEIGEDDDEDDEVNDEEEEDDNDEEEDDNDEEEDDKDEEEDEISKQRTNKQRKLLKLIAESDSRKKKPKRMHAPSKMKQNVPINEDGEEDDNSFNKVIF